MLFPLNFEVAQTNEPIVLFDKDEYQLPLKFSLSNNNFFKPYFINNPLIFDLKVISTDIGIGQVYKFRYLFIVVD